jgi:hypothetical protein
MNSRSHVPNRPSGLDLSGPTEKSGITCAGPTGSSRVARPSSIQFTVQSWWNTPSSMSFQFNPSSAWLPLRSHHDRAGRYASPRLNTAQIIRACLFANATVAMFLLRRVISPCSHLLLRSVLFWQAFTTARAP